MWGFKRNRKAYAKNQIMGNSTHQKAFGEVKTVQKGELRLSLFNQGIMSIEEAYRLYEEGQAVTVA